MPVFDKMKKMEAKAGLKGKAKRQALAARDDSDSSSDDEVNVPNNKKGSSSGEINQKASALQAKKELRKKLRSTKYDDWYAMEGANEDDLVKEINTNLGKAAIDDASDSDDDAAVADNKQTAASDLTRKQKKKAALSAKIAADVAAAEQESAAAAKAAKEAAEAEGAADESGNVQVNFSEPAMWAERMALTATKALPSDLSPDDDPKREEVFIQHAMLSVMRGITMLEKANIPWKRPADYYAEMYKSDVQMEKIRSSVLDSKKKVQEQAHRRAMKDQKKFGKEVQAEVLRQRAKHKRDMLDKVSEWRKKNKGNSDRADLDDVIDDDYGKSAGSHYKGGGVKGASFAGGDKKSRRNHFMQKKSMTPGGANKGARKAPNRPGKNRRKH